MPGACWVPAWQQLGMCTEKRPWQCHPGAGSRNVQCCHPGQPHRLWSWRAACPRCAGHPEGKGKRTATEDSFHCRDGSWYYLKLCSQNLILPNWIILHNLLDVREVQEAEAVSLPLAALQGASLGTGHTGSQPCLASGLSWAGSSEENRNAPPYPCPSSAHSSALRSPRDTAWGVTKGTGTGPLMARAWKESCNIHPSNGISGATITFHLYKVIWLSAT